MGQLVPLKFRPGINREGTSYSNEGGWWHGDKIRFRTGFPETIGGWQKYSTSTIAGTCRNLFAWTSLSGTTNIGVGTNLKYYAVIGSDFFDITPLRATTAAGDVTFAATNGSATLTVSDTGHGAQVGDYVTFSGAVSLGGDVTADILNANHVVASITDANTYTISLSVTANASDTGNGGGSVVGEYEIMSGLESATAGTGYGAGGYGDGGYGEPSEETSTRLILRTWSHDNFGEDLVINPRDGGVYYWDYSGGTSARAVPLSSLSGASDAPTISRLTMVSDQDRHIICLGCDPSTDPGVQDPLLIRWSDQENAADWTARTTNTAGFIRLSSGSRIVAALQTKREILIFTDASVHTMQFIGPPYTFGIQELGKSGQIVGPNAAVAVEDVVYWMGDGKFMRYDGTISEVQCSVREYVFNELDAEQQAKVVAGHNTRFSEVWWFYPTTEGSECEKYVVYNYALNVWYYGCMDRTAWLDSGLLSYPLAASSDGHLYYHEFGLNDGSTNPPQGINAYIESSDQDIEEGDNFVFVSRMIPDITFRNSTGTPSATLTVKMKEFPGDNFSQTDDEQVTQIATVPLEQFTRQVFLRVRGRSFALRLESDGTETAWRIGVPRIEIRRDGKR